MIMGMVQEMNIMSKLHQDFVVKKIKETNWTEGTTGPLVVELDTTEVCNLACPGCISEDLVENKTSFSRDRLLEIGKELYELGVKAVILIGGGEPLAHPAVGELIDYLGKNDIHVGITTNGFFLDQYMDTIAKYSSWTRVSIDAATAQTFDQLRPSKDGKSKFEYIVNNMRKLARVKMGKLGFSYLIRTEADGFGIQSNIQEIYDAAVLARDIGCDYFEVKPSYSYAGGQNHALVKHDALRMEEAKREISRLNELETDTFKIMKAINLEDSLNCVEKKQEKSYHFCPMGHLRTLVCPSGVYVCPYWRGKDNFRFGDAKQSSMKEIWDGDLRKKVMQYTDPEVVCNFHCLRHQSNLDVIDMISKNFEDIDIVNEYDRFF